MLKKLALPTALLCIFILAISCLIRFERQSAETSAAAEPEVVAVSAVESEPPAEDTSSTSSGQLRIMVVTEDCRKRETPYINGEVIEMLKKGAEVTVVGDTVNNYYNLSSGGYVHSDYLTDIASVSSTSSEDSEQVMYTQVSCRRRAEPSMEGEVIEMLKAGTRVTTVRLVDDGYYELDDGSYVHSDYLAETPPEDDGEDE